MLAIRIYPAVLVASLGSGSGKIDRTTAIGGAEFGVFVDAAGGTNTAFVHHHVVAADDLRHSPWQVAVRIAGRCREGHAPIVEGGKNVRD
jgi:hypothetical protein